MWVRGLKLDVFQIRTGSLLSHPVWVRGLKPDGPAGLPKAGPVAPRVGAWIETHLRNRS